MALPQGPNQRWSLDFVSDTLTDSRRFRILAVVDDFTRECLALSPTPPSRALGSAASSMPSSPTRQAAMIVSDNGTELTSMAILRWCQPPRSTGITSHRASRAERLRRKLQRRLRDELLNETLFLSLAHARELLAIGRTTTTPFVRTAPFSEIFTKGNR